MSSRRRGFTFIEILIVMIIFGILSTMAVTRYIDLKNDGYAAQVVGDVHAIRVAATNFYVDSGRWPAPSGEGVVPAELVSLLPQSMSFVRDHYSLRWESSGALTGVEIRADTELLARKLRQRLVRGTPFIEFGGTSIFYVVQSPWIGE